MVWLLENREGNQVVIPKGYADPRAASWASAGPRSTGVWMGWKLRALCFAGSAESRSCAQNCCSQRIS